MQLFIHLLLYRRYKVIEKEDWKMVENIILKMHKIVQVLQSHKLEILKYR